jgi:hypothetical protein
MTLKNIIISLPKELLYQMEIEHPCFLSDVDNANNGIVDSSIFDLNSLWEEWKRVSNPPIWSIYYSTGNNGEWMYYTSYHEKRVAESSMYKLKLKHQNNNIVTMLIQQRIGDINRVL